MTQAQFTVTAALASIDTVHARWLATNPTDKAGNPLTVSADCVKARSYVSPEVCDMVQTMCDKGAVDVSALLTGTNALGTKATFRMFQFFAALSAKNWALVDRETLLVIVGAYCAGAVTRDAIAWASTGKGDQHTSDIVRDQSIVNKVRNVVGAVGASTEQTQSSRSFGSNGFSRLLGMGALTGKVGSRVFTGQDKKNPFARAVLDMVEGATEQTLKVAFPTKGKGK